MDSRDHVSTLDEQTQTIEVSMVCFGGEHGESLAEEGRPCHGLQLATDPEDPAPSFPTNDDEGSSGGQRLSEPLQGCVASGVEDQVVLLTTVSEILTGVVDNPIGT
jgi:hypothetical protein